MYCVYFISLVAAVHFTQTEMWRNYTAQVYCYY
jgi:hypothetical protein